MYRLLKRFTKNPDHLRVLRHIFGVPAEDPPTSTFLDAICGGQVPENLAEMERNYPMFDLLFMEGSREKAVRILVAYFLGNRFPFLLDGLFGKKLRSSAPREDPMHGTYISREVMRASKSEELISLFRSIDGARGTAEVSIEQPPEPKMECSGGEEPYQLLGRNGLTIEFPQSSSDGPHPRLYVHGQQIGFVENVTFNMGMDSTVPFMLISIGTRRDYPEQIRDAIRRNISLLRQAAPFAQIFTNVD